MTTNIVEPALRATYHLAGVDAQRLRRLTRNSGLEAENILSRLAIVQSLAAGDEGPYRDYEPSKSGKTKEIKGSVLLGRPRQAALLLALVAKCHRAEFADPKTALTWHWARGLRLLEDNSSGGDVLLSVAHQLAATQRQKPTGRTRGSGLGDSLRDELAAAVGRRFPRWSTEVCRLVAMTARLDANRLDTVVERLAAEVREIQGERLITETLALRVLKQQWGVNRLGLAAADRDALTKLLAGETLDKADPSLPLLTAIGLVKPARNGPRLTPMGERLGEEATHP